MAITKIHAIKSTLGKALAYIENPDKTDGQMLVSGYNCEPQTASIDFEMTAVLAHKARNLKRKRSTNLAYHLIQSFSPEDAVTPEQAHELGKKLAFEYTGGKYEYVVATHIDKGHIHNHIMLNAVSFYDYKTLRTVPYRTARQIRDISDRLCMEAHLSVIDDPQKIGQLYPENAGKKKSASNRTEIRKRLDFCLERATDYSQFLSMAEGLEITPTIRGKHMSYLLEGAGRAVRDNSLSDTDTFTYAGICARLSDNAQEQKYLRKTITGILRSATGMADFADKLKTAGIETKVKKSTGQVLYRAAVLDGAWVPEDALGSEFTSEGIEYALKNGEVQIAEDAEITLIDRYQELTIQYPEVCTAAVKLSNRQILSAGKNGLVLQVHDDNGNPAKLMVNKSEVTTSPDGEIIFNVGNDFSYDLVYEDGTHGTIRGAKLIQQIDEENNVLPLAVVLTEAAYCALEDDLQHYLDTYESTHDYDEYHFDLDEIEHDPYVLLSLLCALHEGQWTIGEVQGTLQMLFDRQYILTEDVVVETRYRTETDTWTDEDGNSHTDTYQVPYDYYICTVTLENFDLSHVPVYVMGEDQLSRYAIYMATLGNRPDLFPDSPYVNKYITGKPGDYEVPGEYLDDETFAAMLAEAQKYIGYPYVWGGSSPATSFDCSGYVSWVINHSGWNVGRLGAQGLYNICTPTSSPKPGDLVFFKGTYDTPGVSHCGIYVGDGKMLHCGDPIGYANLNTSYWQSHFYAYGRLP